MANNNWQDCPLLRQILQQVAKDVDNAITSCEMPATARSRFENFAGYIEGILGKEGDRDG